MCLCSEASGLLKVQCLCVCVCTRSDHGCGGGLWKRSHTDRSHLAWLCRHGLSVTQSQWCGRSRFRFYWLNSKQDNTERYTHTHTHTDSHTLTHTRSHTHTHTQ